MFLYLTVRLRLKRRKSLHSVLTVPALEGSIRGIPLAWIRLIIFLLDWLFRPLVTCFAKKKSLFHYIIKILFTICRISFWQINLLLTGLPLPPSLCAPRKYRFTFCTHLAKSQSQMNPTVHLPHLCLGLLSAGNKKYNEWSPRPVLVLFQQSQHRLLPSQRY